jgi:hypothetical protein
VHGLHGSDPKEHATVHTIHVSDPKKHARVHVIHVRDPKKYERVLIILKEDFLKPQSIIAGSFPTPASYRSILILLTSYPLNLFAAHSSLPATHVPSWNIVTIKR